MKTLHLYMALALLAACGPAQRQDARTYGGALNPRPRQVSGSGDAVASGPGGSAAPATPAGPGGPDGSTGAASASATVQVGIRNYAAVNATMAALTGVPPTTAAVQTAFNSLATAMPTDTNVQAFLGSNQVAVYKLAVEYCNALSNDTTQRAAVYGAFNFAAAPAAAFTPPATSALADALIAKFWGTGLASLPDHQTSVAGLTAFINDLVASKGASAATTMTPAIVTAACTVALASAPVTLY
jgi:hypothetical protein